MLLFAVAGYAQAPELSPVKSSAFVEVSGCRVIGNGGELEIMKCDHPEYRIRCYADIVFDGGFKTRVYGASCYPDYSDCWASG